MVEPCQNPGCLPRDVVDGVCMVCGRVQLKRRETAAVELAVTLKTLTECRVSSAEFHPDGTLSKVSFRDPEPPAPEKQTEPQGSSVELDDVDRAAHFLATRSRGKNSP